jgi:prepilin-type N-terminal cleavage/methylation domain-containing protein/prepilin-type processing-associated H-X9-DG protein
MNMRRRGFTLIELLVVIAIIGILAAMLFPVFARARESARKTQCLANVKNIATALNMYLADWDKWVPNETNREVIDFFNAAPGYNGASHTKTWPDVCNRARQANPYLRDAVVIEDYVKSRDVYKCPSAKVMNGAGVIIPMGRDGFWLNAWRDNTWWQGPGNRDIGPCYVCWPSGWGGDVTDSFTQHTMASTLATAGATGRSAGNNVFVQGIGFNDNLHFLSSLSGINDAARYIACGDTGRHIGLWDANGLAYPDTCATEGCGATSCGYGNCAGADWDNCPATQICGITYAAEQKFLYDPVYRKTFTRHMGGSNVGFVDGHAKWSLSESIMMQSAPYKDAFYEGDLCACWPGNGVI